MPKIYIVCLSDADGQNWKDQDIASNKKFKGIQWHFNVEKARAKLKSFYPIIEKEQTLAAPSV